MEKYDAIIIGFGKGGKTLGGRLAGAGKKVALIEKSKEMYGGTCINVGCIPSKFLIKNAEQIRSQKDASFEEKAAAYARMIHEKRQLTGMLRGKNYNKLASQPTAKVYDGAARFLSPHQVEVSTQNGAQVLEAEHIFINTGAVPVVPPIPGIKGNPFVYTSDGLMDLDRLPKNLVIIGGGYIGVEFASMYSGLGSSVIVVQDHDVFLPREDEDIAHEMKKTLEGKGVTFHLGGEVSSIENKGDRAEVIFKRAGEELRLSADAVLIATGRKPNTASLDLTAAGIEMTERGAVKVDEKLRASVPGVWAMGDVTGGPQFTYVSLDDYRNVLSQLDPSFPYHAEHRSNVPSSVFISPPYSRVGLNEREARAAGYLVKVAKMPASAIPKAQVLGQTEGVLKAVVDGATGKILGVMLFCEESHEMINLVKLAMDLGADYTVLRDQIYTHPTMSETLNELFSML